MATSQEGRDWLKTLWPASYKGVPFYFESDKSAGGRDNVKHTFPHRDDGFIEDMGRALRFFSGTAYVHGDDCDALAVALETALEAQGSGMLVLPLFGPVTVHCETFERATERDKMGFVGFDLKFVRAGAASALISLPLLANVGYIAAGELASTLASAFSQSITTLHQADYVVAAASDALSSAAAVVDVMRTTYPVDPGVSASLRDQVAAYVAADQITDVTTATEAAGAAANLIGLIRQLGDGMPADSAARAALDLADAFPAPAPANVTVAGKPYASPLAVTAANNAIAAAQMIRLAGLTAYAEAVLRQTFASRPDGMRARGALAARFEVELYNCDGAANADLYVAIETLRGRVIDWLAQTITTLAPVVAVETAASMPSLALAWRLYADPSRADELVARNGVRDPAFMPRQIEALAR
jgi:prophage DNA circulation protein